MFLTPDNKPPGDLYCHGAYPNLLCRLRVAGGDSQILC
jgi:hypothetical protein